MQYLIDYCIGVTVGPILTLTVDGKWENSDKPIYFRSFDDPEIAYKFAYTLPERRNGIPSSLWISDERGNIVKDVN